MKIGKTVGVSGTFGTTGFSEKFLYFFVILELGGEMGCTSNANCFRPGC